MSKSKYYKLSADILQMPLTPRAMIIYSILADRQELSRKNELFQDKNGCYIIFRINDICEITGIGERTAKYALAELEDAGLIERKKQGRNHPQKIYVHEVQKSALYTPDKVQKIAPPEVQKIAPPEVQKIAPPNNNTDTSSTDTSSSAAATSAATTSRIPELIAMIDECAAELKKTITDKDRLKLLKKIVIDSFVLLILINDTLQSVLDICHPSFLLFSYNTPFNRKDI